LRQDHQSNTIAEKHRLILQAVSTIIFDRYLASGEGVAIRGKPQADAAD